MRINKYDIYIYIYIHTYIHTYKYIHIKMPLLAYLPLSIAARPTWARLSVEIPRGRSQRERRVARLLYRAGALGEMSHIMQAHVAISRDLSLRSVGHGSTDFVVSVHQQSRLCVWLVMLDAPLWPTPAPSLGHLACSCVRSRVHKCVCLRKTYNHVLLP